MNRIILGKSEGKNIELNLDVLLRTHLLIWASTGGGKSWLIRRLAEQLFGRVPVIIVDREGEFSTLREKFGFVLVGQGGETPADMRSAKLVAEKLLEVRASAVCDLYELKHETRHEWVKAFVNGLVDAPKRLWGPTIIIIDEAHLFCPEKGQGESVAYGAVADLAGQGRKRGFGIVLATQRLSKLSKNATGEMFNQAAGPTARQADRDRAAYEMGISDRKEIKEFSETLRRLENGNFFFQGRAIAMDRVLVKVGTVETSHPEAGSTKFKAGPPPAPEEIKALLPRLADLPKAAEDKARTEGELKAEVRRLKAELSAAKRSGPALIRPQEIKVADPRAIERAVRPLRTVLEEAMKVIVKLNSIGFEDMTLKPEDLTKLLESTGKEISKLAKAGLAKRSAEFENLKLETNRLLRKLQAALSEEKLEINVNVTHNEPFTVQAPAPHFQAAGKLSDGDLPAGALRMLKALASRHPLKLTRAQLGTLAGFTPSGGTFGNYYGLLRRGRLIDELAGGSVAITEAGLETAGEVPEPPATTEEILTMWRRNLPAGAAKMLDVLVDAHPGGLTREELGERTGFAASGGTFGNYFGLLRRNELVEVEGPEVRASETLFLGGKE